MKIHRRALAIYKRYQHSPPTAVALMQRSWQVLLFFILAAGVLAAVAPRFGQFSFLIWIAVGMMLGAIVRDYGICRQWVRSWPTLNAILDWKRVDDLLAEDASAKPVA